MPGRSTRDLGEHPFRPCHVQETEGAGDRVHAGVGQRDRLGVGDPELDARVPPGRLGDHGRGEVHPDHLGTAPGRGGGERAGAAGNVEQAHAGSGLDSVQERRDGFAGDGAEGVVPVARLAVPARQFDVAEGMPVQSEPPPVPLPRRRPVRWPAVRPDARRRRPNPTQRGGRPHQRPEVKAMRVPSV
jgi:hypothetical protein